MEVKLLLAVALFKASNASTGVKDLLLTGVERVALRADIGADDAVSSGAASRECAATRARDGGLDICRVNIGLHDFLSRALGQSAARSVNQNQSIIVPPMPSSAPIRVRFRATSRLLVRSRQVRPLVRTVRWVARQRQLGTS